jgi:hypothetical protein
MHCVTKMVNMIVRFLLKGVSVTFCTWNYGSAHRLSM